MPDTLVANEPAVASKPKNTVKVVRGQHHKFMLIPVMAHHAAWFDAGPIAFAVEARVLGDAKGNVGERGASLHVFTGDRTQELLRFDDFEHGPHYHYILQADQHNVVWGYDAEVNGPMQAWALNAIRTRLPAMLRKIGADAVADAVERDGFDTAVLDDVAAELKAAHARTYSDAATIGALAREGRDWMARWKALHPEFNTVDD